MFKLDPASLDWALAHINAFGDTDIFPIPFEYEAIEQNWRAVRSHLEGEDLDIWSTRPHRECFSPKGRYSYRLATQLDPLDSLIYLAVLYEKGQELERYRVPTGEDIVFSYRFAPQATGEMYDEEVGWSSFKKSSRERAEVGSVNFVVLTDISDFYHRLYHHPIENCLHTATSGSAQARVLVKLLSQWRGKPSFGIPVGPAPSRLIAEAAIDDVDKLLLANKANFCRYSDDYRLFCRTKIEAYGRLSQLAEVLYRNHGLTLQPGKTRIVEADEFLELGLGSPESEELNNLEAQFEKIVEMLELESPYETIVYEELDDEMRKLVDELNLEDLLESALAKDEVDIGLMKFLLSRLAQLNDSDVATKLMRNAGKCYPVLSAMVEYLAALTEIPAARRVRIGAYVVKLLRSSIVGHLPYHRGWLLSLFARGSGWGQEKELVSIYEESPEPFTRRKAVLAMGRAKQAYWFRTRLDGSAMNLEAWERRAFLAAASCLPKDERKYWYQSQRGRFDVLERAVVDWATANPFQ